MHLVHLHMYIYVFTQCITHLYVHVHVHVGVVSQIFSLTYMCIVHVRDFFCT